MICLHLEEVHVTDDVTQFKERQRKAWSTGSWDEVSELIAGVGPRLLDRVGIEPGADVLDIGTGSGGSVAIPAALRGARVIGCDITPELFDDARRRAAEAGVEVEWVQGDAEALPFGDAGFDRVLSTFGHIFAPRHALAAAELARVCRPGGVVAFTAWRPGGFWGAIIERFGRYLPPSPDFVEDSTRWGTEEYVRTLLEPHGLAPEFDRDTVTLEFESPEAFMAFYMTKCGTYMTAKASVGERWPELEREMVAAIEAWSDTDDGSVRIEPEYLVTVARKPR
jgi:SAM-dependent methyltransferase